MAGTSLDIIASRIKQGSIAAFSTDTINGIGAVFDNASSIEKIFIMKGRSREKPFSLFFSSKEMLFDFFPAAKIISAIADEFLPGKITVIARPKRRVNPLLLKDGMASFRMPEKSDILEIIKKIGKPLAATSLNISGESLITNRRDAEKTFEGIEVINKLSRRIVPSTIVKVAGSSIEIVREGAVPAGVFLERINKHLQ